MHWRLIGAGAGTDKELMSLDMPRIVIVEDQLSLQASLQRGLSEEGFEVLTAGTGQSAYALISREPVDAIIFGLDAARR